jgi:hypothetical protein
LRHLASENRTATGEERLKAQGASLMKKVIEKNSSGNTKGDGRRSVHYFVECITAQWNKQVETILETGRLLIQAKDELPHGKFSVMVAKQLPFGPRAAQMMMTIAKNPVLSNAKYISHLPPSWGTLYDLAGLPESQLTDLIERRAVRPDMERSDVKKLHFARLDQVQRAVDVLFDFMCRVPAEELASKVVFNSWPEEKLSTAARKLPSYVEELLLAVQRYHEDRAKAIDEYCDQAKRQSLPTRSNAS